MLICPSHLKGAELFWAGRPWPFGSPWSTCVRERALPTGVLAPSLGRQHAAFHTTTLLPDLMYLHSYFPRMSRDAGTVKIFF